MDLRGTYYRWSRGWAGDREDSVQPVVADILGSDTSIMADPQAGTVLASIPGRPLSPDEARMIGVRLIEGAALADNGRSIRHP